MIENTKTRKTTELTLTNQDIIDLLIKAKVIKKKDLKESKVEFKPASPDSFTVDGISPILVTIITES